jgi:predicted secreted protein
MRRFLLLFLAGMTAISARAQNGKTNGQIELKDGPSIVIISSRTVTNGLAFLASAGTVSAPFVLTNGYLCQPGERAEVGEGGKAVYDFAITNAGDYVIYALVNAPGEDSNSFFLNIDAKPEDPLMIWDIEPTSGFEERVVSWRGDGSDGADQFAQKRFKLAEGKHQLIIFGREPETQLKSLSIRPAKPEPNK